MPIKFVESIQAENSKLDKIAVMERTKIRFLAIIIPSMASVNRTAPFNFLKAASPSRCFAHLPDSYVGLEGTVIKNSHNSHYGSDVFQSNTFFGISVFKELTLKSLGSKNDERVENFYGAGLFYRLLADNKEDMTIIYRKEEKRGAIDEMKRERLMIDLPETGKLSIKSSIKWVMR